MWRCCVTGKLTASGPLQPVREGMHGLLYWPHILSPNREVLVGVLGPQLPVGVGYMSPFLKLLCCVGEGSLCRQSFTNYLNPLA